MLQGESQCLHPILDGILFVAAKQLPSPNCFSDGLINIPLLNVTVAAGSARKILMHELCMLCSFFSLRAQSRVTEIVKTTVVVSCIK